MAWRSSGTTNDEMIDNLKRFGVVSSPWLEQAFRKVDRKFFVPKGNEDLAHSDQPLKEGNVHISAPHIYGSALEALDLRPNSSLSFLNLGSGTGYVSSVVAHILGPHSSNFGVEIHNDVVEHANKSIQAWKNSRLTSNRDLPEVKVMHGNALHIDSDCGEGCRGFDRIYVGAALDRDDVKRVTRLLKVGGIMVGPVEDELVKITRLSKKFGSEDDYSKQVISGVRFAPLLSGRSIKITIPSQVWDPSIHNSYPDSFRNASKEILLCNQATHLQPVKPSQSRNMAAVLPKHLWLEVLSYTTRDWFDTPRTEEDFLRRRLEEEQKVSLRERRARQSAEARLQIAERERDVYRLLARRWQTRLQALMRGSSDEDMEALLPERELISLSTMFLRGFGESEDEEDESQDEEDDLDMEAEEDHDVSEDGQEEEPYEFLAEDQGDADSFTSAQDAMDESNISMSASPTTLETSTLIGRPTLQDVFDESNISMSSSPTAMETSSLISRPTARSVSVTSEDL